MQGNKRLFDTAAITLAAPEEKSGHEHGYAIELRICGKHPVNMPIIADLHLQFQNGLTRDGFRFVTRIIRSHFDTVSTKPECAIVADKGFRTFMRADAWPAIVGAKN